VVTTVIHTVEWFVLFTVIGFLIGLIVIPIMGQKIREGTNKQTVAFGEEYYAQRWVQAWEKRVAHNNFCTGGSDISRAKQEALWDVWHDIQVAARGVAHKPKNVEGVEDTWEVWPNYDQAGSVVTRADNSERRGDEQALSGSGGNTGAAGLPAVVREPDVDGTLSTPPPDVDQPRRLAGVPADARGVTIDVWRKAHVTP
jgi:hypothetical protein